MSEPSSSRFSSWGGMRIGCMALSLLAALWLPGDVLAQGSQKHPPPVEPYIKTLPASVSWTATVSTKPVTDEKGQIRPQIVRTHTTIQDAVRREIQTWSNGTTTQRWNYQGTELFEQLNVPGIAIMRGGQAPSNFPRLDWISSDNYLGVRAHEERPCYVFQRTQAAPAGAKNTSSQQEQVWIDIETGRPLLWRNGETLWLFQFGPGPNQPLTLPPNFRQTLENYLKAVRAPEQHRMKF